MDGDPADGLSVRVRGDAAGIVATAVESVDSARVVDGHDADAVVVVGEDAFLALAADPPDAPILPVADGGGPLVVARDDVGRAVASLADGTADRVDHPVLAARLDGERAGRALADASLVTSEPARISEYAVDADGRRVAGFRADGVVVATPLGSAGYARSAGGPVVAPGTGLAVVPIAPFATAFDAWVCRPPVDLSVERDEGPVSLVLDGSVAGEVAPHGTVRVDAPAAVELLVPPAAGDEWKHSNE